jgi:hypothetical protein
MTRIMFRVFCLAAMFAAFFGTGYAAPAAWLSIRELSHHMELASAGATQPAAPYTFDGNRIVRR